MIDIKHQILRFKILIIIFITLIICVPILFMEFEKGNRKASCVASVTIMMSIFWITEIIPLYITSLLPLIIFPFFQIGAASEIAASYFNDTIFLLFGSFIMGFAITRWRIDKRISLKIVLMMGGSPKKLLLGIMYICAFLSMWISNTGTSAIMVPMVLGLMSQFNKNETENLINQSTELSEMSTKNEIFEENENNEKETKINIDDVIENNSNFNDENEILENGNDLVDSNHHIFFEKALLLGVAYSCSLGGIGTLIGSGPQLVLSIIVKKFFNEEISFVEWFFFGFPLTVVLVFCLWCFFVFFYLRKTKVANFNLNLVKNEYDELGKMKFEQFVVIVSFVTLILLWFFRSDIGVMKGWSNLFGGSKYVKDGTTVLLITFILFLIPTFTNHNQADYDDGPATRIVEWKLLKNLPWGILFLLGCGFTLAEYAVKTNLSSILANTLLSVGKLPLIMLMFLCCAFTTFLTELFSNTATSNILLPIIASISQTLKLNNYILLIPVTISASFAFALPAATPPNTIVFSTKKLTVMEMLKIGVLLNFFALFVLVIWSRIMIPIIF